MSTKNYIKFVVAFGVLAILLIFLGVNFVSRISASSLAKETARDVAENTGLDYLERPPSTVAGQMNYAGAVGAGANVKIAPVFDITGAVVSDPTGTLLNASQSGDLAVSVMGTDRKIAPVFDVNGAIVSDPTGTLWNAIQSGELAVPVLGTDMKIAPVFDVNGAIVSDPTGTILSVINP